MEKTDCRVIFGEVEIPTATLCVNLTRNDVIDIVFFNGGLCCYIADALITRCTIVEKVTGILGVRGYCKFTCLNFVERFHDEIVELSEPFIAACQTSNCLDC